MHYKRMKIEVDSPEEKGYSNIVYNLAESSYRDQRLSDFGIGEIDDLLAYIPHRGDEKLRRFIIDDSADLTIYDVLLTAGAAMALFIVYTTLLTAKDHVIIMRPNYASALETPSAIGCDISYLDLRFEDSFQPSTDDLKKLIRPQTKIISITTPHNPTGVLIHEEFILAAIKLVEQNNIILLIDETYRELNFKTPLYPYYASKSSHVISVSSMSKAYGTPGLRMGWLISKNKELMEKFLAAKEQIILCNSTLDEVIAGKIMHDKHNHLSKFHTVIQDNFNLLKSWMENQQYLEWIEPDAGVVCFARLKNEYIIDIEKLKKILLHDYKTFVGYGEWFEQEDRFFRIGFGYPSAEELSMGLNNLLLCLKQSIVSSPRLFQ
jgi:aspartate/methionine/tyrosine aminotransferase